MKPVWKWVIGIAAVLVLAALVVGAVFLVRGVLPLHRVALQFPNGDQPREFGQRGFDNRGFGPEGMPGFGMRGYGMHGFGMMGMIPFGGIFSGLFFLVILALVVLGIIWLVRRSQTPKPVVVAHACQNCGKPVLEDWKNCPYCGKKIKS